jgi:very-short-patch-repair endonuclease
VLGNVWFGEDSKMQSQEKFSLLRSILRMLGLSADAVDDIVDRIVDFLSDKDEKAASSLEYPYHLRDSFLSPAEHSFYLVLKNATAESMLVCPKVALGDLFYASSKDASKYRIYTNKIDRKHVDFLLCDPKTVRPLLGVELDDRSHKRDDRRTRDEFVDRVFAAAHLPLLRIPTKQGYSLSELTAAIKERIGGKEPHSFGVNPADTEVEQTSRCPKCGSPMVLRTAKSGPNQGKQFWGCTNYPRCNGVVKYEPQPARSA